MVKKMLSIWVSMYLALKTPSIGPALTTDPPRPSALQSSALPTELILPQILHLSGNRNGQAS